MVTRYSKLTMKLIIDTLKKADRYDKRFVRELQKATGRTIKEIIKELRKLEKSGKIRFDKSLKLRDHPEAYRAIKEIEWIAHLEMSAYLGYCVETMGSYLSSVYKNTAFTTFQIFADTKYYQNTFRNISPQTLITDTYIINNVLPIPWCKDGKVYSQRLYSHVANFQSKLSFVLEQGIEKGKGLDWMVRAWKKLTGTAAYEATRLIQTETMAYWSRATKDSYLKMGITYVEIVGSAECGTICVDAQSEGPIPLAEAEIGDLLPPYHPFCACSFIAYQEEVETDEI